MIEARPRSFTFLVNNEITVLVSGQETGGAYCLMESTTPPGAGGNSLHTDPFLETFYLLDGELEFTVDRNGKLVTFRPAVGEPVFIGHGQKHKFTCVGDRPARALVVGLPSYEEFFRALARAWPQDHWDPVETPAAMASVTKRFGVEFI